MNRAGKKPLPIDLNDLMPESCFMDLSTFNSEQVRDHIEDKEAHQKTLHAMLHEAIKQKKRERNKKI